MSSTTPTTKRTVTLSAHYGTQEATIRGDRWPNGDVWISARQLRAAEKRAGVATGDYLEHLGGSSSDGYLVAQGVA